MNIRAIRFAYIMSRHLDYCGEMLSLIGEIASIYILHWHDDIAVRAVNEVERMTAGLSQKFFQKINYHSRHAERPAPIIG